MPALGRSSAGLKFHGLDIGRLERERWPATRTLISWALPPAKLGLTSLPPYEKRPPEPRKTSFYASSREMGYNERRTIAMLQEPITKEQFERELLNVPPKEADSRREFWTLCEALQAMEDTKYPPPDWFIESFRKVLGYTSEERAEPWRELRHRLLVHLGEFQREPRATRQERKRFRRY